MERSAATELNDLPDECLFRVLKLLVTKTDRNSVVLTCRRWHRIHRTNRKRLFFEGVRDDPGFARTLSRLLEQCTQVKEISFILCTKVVDSDFAPFASGSVCLSHLETLALSYCLQLTDSALEYIARACGSTLKFLNLSRSNKITDAGLAALAARLGGLQTLVLSNLQGVSDLGVEILLDACHLLENITVTYCPHIRGWGFRHGQMLKIVDAECSRFLEEDLAKGVQGMAGLRSFKMGFSMQAGFICPSRALRSLGNICRSLEVLCLQKCRVLDDSAVENIARGCSELRELNLSVCPEVSLNGWQAIAQYSLKLELLFVYRCGLFCDESLHAVQNFCPCLLKIGFYGCHLLSSMAMDRFRVMRPSVSIATEL